MNPDIKGIISDMDGVILDTEKLYVRFWCEAALFYGYPMETHHALSIRSMARPFAIAKLKGFLERILTTARFTIKELSLWISSSRKTALNQSPVPLNFSAF